LIGQYLHFVSANHLNGSVLATQFSEGPLVNHGIPHWDPQKDAMNVGGGVLRQVAL